MQGVQRYVVFSFLALGLLAWATFGRILSGILFAAGVSDAALIGSNFTVTSLLGMVLGAALAIIGYRNPRAQEYCTEVVGELKKVTWPSTKETQTATVVVIITSIIMALLMGVFDQIWASATGIIYK